jgi:Tol biopolymer transport system component
MRLKLIVVPLIVVPLIAAVACSDEPSGPDYRSIGPILFTSTRDGTGPERDIYAVNVDGSGIRRLTADPSDDSFPRWSPDGRRIAFTSGRDSVRFGNVWARVTAIYVINADGTGIRRFSDLADVAVHPAWSPDGSRIAFARMNGTPTSGIWVANIDGTGKTQLTSAGVWDDFAPQFTPDGRRIIFLSTRIVGGGFATRLFSMRTDGTDVTEIPRPYSGGSITWYDLSSDGRLLAFSKYDGPDDIYTMTVAGTDLKRLTEDAGEDTHPVWSPDGARLLFTSGRDGNAEVYSMTASGTDVRRLTTHPSFDLGGAWRP